VLQPSLSLSDQIILLIATTLPFVTRLDLLAWSEASDKRYFMKILRGFHKKRFIEFDENLDRIQLLPPGALYVQTLIKKKNLSSLT
jgi:hypothetical protein